MTLFYFPPWSVVSSVFRSWTFDKCRQIVGTSHRLGSLAKSGELLPTHPFLAGAHSD